MRKVILGPWQHSGNSKYDMHGVSFGSQALRFDLDWLYFRWFEHHLKEVDNGIDQTAPVEYYTLARRYGRPPKTGSARDPGHPPVSG